MARIDTRLIEPARYPLRIEISTRYADVDPQQHINNVAMAAAFEDTRVRFHVQAGVYETFGDIGTMIAANHIDYLAEATYPAPLVMFTGALAIGRTSWTLGAIATQGGRVAAFAKGVMVAVRAGRPTDLPSALRDALSANLIRLD